MTQSDIKRGTLGYWKALFGLLQGKPPLLNLDRTLPEAFNQSKTSAGWSGGLLYVSVLIGWQPGTPHWLTQWSAQPGLFWTIAILAGIGLGCCWIACLYGLLRLFTLVNHVLVTTVFKVRGQRLRLLNLETDILPLGVVTSIGLACLHLSVSVGLSIVFASLVYGLVWLSVGYNAIFHTHRLRGLGLVIGGIFLTGLVFAIGIIAIGIMLGVMAFIIAALIRPFHHA